MTTDIRDILDENGCWIFSGSLEEGFALLKNHSVPILDLRDIPCASLPKSISKIKDLEEVYLDNNGLPELPTQIGAISKLRILSLGRNKITKIPHSIEQRWMSLQKLFWDTTTLEPCLSMKNTCPFSNKAVWGAIP